MKNKAILSTTLLAAIVVCLSQCKKTTEADRQLFEKSTQSNFVYYKGDSSIVPSSSATGHNPFFRVRFNQTAQAALTDSGKLPIGGSFPDGAVIVKELYNSANGELALLAVMEKAPGNSAAGNGWLWAEFKPDGSAAFSTSKKGDGCTSCHNDAGNRDYVRLFELFP